MISLGPVPIPLAIIILAAALACSVAWLLTRKQPETSSKSASAIVLDALFVGLVAARLGYIVQWWEEYSAAPWSMLSIGDGGFAVWAGIPASIVFLSLKTSTSPFLRRAVFVSWAIGLMLWGTASITVGWFQHASQPLPDLQVLTMDGESVELSSFKGQPVVVNLWASWCPPCRREMPAFQDAQSTFPHVAFVMVNQGEGVEGIDRFLENEKLNLSNVLRDPASRSMQAMGAYGLPATLFFDAEGRLVNSHMGELTTASLKHIVLKSFPPTTHISQE